MTRKKLAHSPLVIAPSNLLMAILACWYDANSIVAVPVDRPERSYWSGVRRCVELEKAGQR